MHSSPFKSRNAFATGRWILGTFVWLSLCLAPTGMVAAVGEEVATSRGRVDSLGDPLPANALLRMGTLRFRAPSVVKELRLTKDQRTLISFGELLMAWDTATGKELWRAPAREFGVRLPTSYGLRAMATQPDGQHVLTAGNPGSILSWDPRSGQRENLRFDPPPPGLENRLGHTLYSIDVTSDGDRYAIGNAGGLTVYDRNRQRVYASEGSDAPGMREILDQMRETRDRLRFGGAYVYGIFSPDGELLAVTDDSEPKAVDLRDAESGRDLRQINGSDRIVRMAFSPNGKKLVTTERDTAVRLYDVESTELQWTFAPAVDRSSENYTSAVSFSPDGKWIAVAERNQQLYLLNATTGHEVTRSQDHSWNPWALAFTADSSLLYSSGWGGTIHRWSIPSMEQVPLPAGVHSNSVVAASPAGDRCAFSDQSGRVHLLEPETGEELLTLSLVAARYDYLEFSPDGEFLAAGGTCRGDLHVAVWGVADGALRHRWEWQKGTDRNASIEALRFSPDSRQLAAASFRQDQVRLWQLKSGELIQAVDHPDVYGLCFSADGTELLTAGWDRTIRVWEANSGRALRGFEIPEDDVGNDRRMYTVCSEPSGKLLATAHIGREIRLWDPNEMKMKDHLSISGSFNFGSMRFTPDGLWLAAGSSVGAVDIFDPWTAEKVHEVEGHDDGIYMVGFGGDNRYLYTGGAGVCYRWTLRPESADVDRSVGDSWKDLRGTDGRRAYVAWWELVEGGEKAANFILDQLENTSSIVRPVQMAATDDVEELQRRVRLIDRMIDSKQGVERAVTVRRAISVLSHIGTARSAEAIDKLSKHSLPEISELASVEMQRR